MRKTVCVGQRKYTKRHKHTHTHRHMRYFYTHTCTALENDLSLQWELGSAGMEIPAALRQDSAPCRCYLSPSSVQLQQESTTKQNTHRQTHTCRDTSLHRFGENIKKKEETQT